MFDVQPAENVSADNNNFEKWTSFMTTASLKSEADKLDYIYKNAVSLIKRLFIFSTALKYNLKIVYAQC